ncbi:hypothetical protein V6N12_031613 [Hibiscus sabdariffa]|uniref:Uncharacterized protein n=1 Tax=Hibiscus sabdariffa TaxID=183260 RepID=A0ABR2DW51_9ROSI
MEESKREFLPMRHGISLSKEMCPSTPQERERISQIPYASAIGSIMYAMISVKNILKYLRRTKDVFLVYGGEEELRIKGYTDASFQTDKDDSRSQSGFVFCLNGGAVSWKSSKQDTVADSTTEAEYIAASEAAKEAVWIKKFITGLGVIPSISDAVDLYCDNNGAIAQEKEPRSHQRSKHVLRRFHLIREIIDQGDVEICKVHTDDNIADPLTKPLAQQKHDRHTESLGIRYKSHNIRSKNPNLAAQSSSLLLGIGTDFPIPGKGCFAIFGLFGKEFPNLFALKFIRVNYVEVETIFSWRLRIQVSRNQSCDSSPGFLPLCDISGNRGTKEFVSCFDELIKKLCKST